MNRAVLRTDGGSRGNPGPAGAGFVIAEGDRVVCEGGRYLGTTTNNVAEYEALVWGLENALALGYTQITVLADSELLVRQLNGIYKVKSAKLKPYASRALELLDRFESTEVTHVRREENAHADELANAAMDARDEVGSAACPPGGASAQDSLF